MMRSSPGAIHSGALLRIRRARGKSRVRMTLDSNSSAWKPPEWVTRKSGIMQLCALLFAEGPFEVAPDSHPAVLSQPGCAHLFVLVGRLSSLQRPIAIAQRI